jgi:hypothetical protein
MTQIKRTFYEAASRPRGDEHMPVLIEWHEPAYDYDEVVMASIKILTDVPQMTRKAAKEYAKAYLNEWLKELNQ